MRITAINGSPKTKGSTSEQIVKQMERILGEEICLYHVRHLTQDTSVCESEALGMSCEALLDTDVLLIVFPLYVDGIPAHLIELLTRLEVATRDMSVAPHIYAVANCGLYEPEHAALALDMIGHFAKRAGLTWGCGLGIGGGGMLSSMGSDWSKGPASSVDAALRTLVDAMREGESLQHAFVVPRFPRFLYIAAANMGWHLQARRSGAQKRMKAQPYLE
ncbi:MAG: NAD(P)H-dependent oxidoreductase [Coriobacteriia bacterium]|nr:NAD(P)H-dependent oxidoreductase [Coriobacteriia bacterium]